MKINWKLRLQNKATLTAIIFAFIAIVYKILDICGVIPQVGQDTIKELSEMIIFLLCLLGIVVDPTTAGTSDSERAMEYTEPVEKEEKTEETK